MKWGRFYFFSLTHSVYSHAAWLFILKNRTDPNLKGAKPFLKADLKSYDIIEKKILPFKIFESF
jgi:hypothetical protein